MKKTLLLIFGLSAGIFASAQNKTTQKYIYKKSPRPQHAEATTPISVNTNAGVATNKKQQIITNATITDIPTQGSSSNIFSITGYPGKSLLDYNPTLNTLTLTHRANPATDGSANSGFYRFDYSKDGGTTWSGQLGPIYDGVTNLGRYPQGFIVNPVGNLIPDSAYIAYQGSSFNSGATQMVGYNHGSCKLSAASTACQMIDYFDSTVTFTGDLNYSGVMINSPTGSVAWTSTVQFDSAANDYTDTILLNKGVWNPITKCLDWSAKLVAFPLVVPSGSNAYRAISTTHASFSADGMTGYLAAAACADLTFAPDSSAYITVWKTTDGGLTWSAPYKIDMDVNTQMGTTGVNYSAAFELDGAVDMTGKLHLILGIAPATGSLNSIDVTPGTWGEFSIITDGSSNTKTLLNKPQTFAGRFIDATPPGVNTLNEPNRGQIAISEAGDEIFYVWFDTDTSVNTPEPANLGNDNVKPNAWVRTYHVGSSAWDPATDITSGTNADGLCTFAMVAYYASPGTCGTGSYQLHIAYSALSGTTLQSVSYHYLNGVCITSAGELANNVFNVGNVYPNPVSGNATFEISMKKADKISIEISNMLGQVMYTSNANFSTGTHKFTVEAGKWNSGVYFYTVKSKDFSITKKLVRE